MVIVNHSTFYKIVNKKIITNIIKNKIIRTDIVIYK